MELHLPVLRNHLYRKIENVGRTMSDVNEVLSLYKSSSFYKKYKDTYFSDIILRDALKCKNSIHRYYGLSKMSYEDVHRLSTDVLRDLFNKFAKEVDFNDIELFWKMIYSFYIDPDSNGLKELNGIQCTADGYFLSVEYTEKMELTSKLLKSTLCIVKFQYSFFLKKKTELIVDVILFLVIELTIHYMILSCI